DALCRLPGHLLRPSGPTFAYDLIHDQAMVSYRCKKYSYRAIDSLSLHHQNSFQWAIGFIISRRSNRKLRFPAKQAIFAPSIVRPHFSKWDVVSNFSYRRLSSYFVILIAPKP